MNGFKYRITSSSTVEVIGKTYYNDKNDVIIPESVNYYEITYSVTSIGSYAFRNCSSLTSVTIPNSVTSIGNKAFYDCSRLTSVTIPNSVTSIGDGAFYECSRLTSVTIPNSVTSIGDFSFQYCSSLTSVTIGNSVTSIGKFAFFDCSSLASVTIPNSVTSIGDGAFYGCSSLASVTIPNSVTSIGNNAFLRCTSLASVTIPNSVTSIGASAFGSCYSLASVTIPNSVTSIGDGTFSNCISLASVTIPNSVTSIGNNAFNNCWKSLVSVTIPNSVTSIGIYAFAGCSSLVSVTIPNSVTSIGKNTFAVCKSLASVTIPNSVTSIGDGAFLSCSSLASVTIPNSVTSIGDYAFERCTRLSSVTIGNSVTSIGSSAFYGCSNLITVISLNTTPPEIYSFDNSTYEKATLQVPIGCKTIYRQHPCWENFKKIKEIDASNIQYNLTYLVDGEVYKTFKLKEGETITPEEEPTKEGYTFSGWNEIPETMPAHDVIVTGTFEKDMIKGDANGDGLVNVTDIVATVNYIMNNPSTDFIFDAADVNQDGKVNVTDIVATVNIIIKGNGASSPLVAPTSGNLVISGNNIHLKNTEAYTAVQFNINLSDGQSISDVVLNGSSDHSLSWKMIDANTCRVVAYSMTNAAFRVNSDNLFSIIVNGGLEEAAISNELLIQAEGVTGIDAIRTEAENGKVYDLNGRQVKNPKKGIYIMNGKKVFIK